MKDRSVPHYHSQMCRGHLDLGPEKNVGGTSVLREMNVYVKFGMSDAY